MESQRDPRRRPTHPGTFLREIVMAHLKITQGDLAAHLGVSRVSVSELLNQRRGVSAEMALRLAAAFPETSPESWLRMQEAVDIWDARQKSKIAVKPIAA